MDGAASAASRAPSPLAGVPAPFALALTCAAWFFARAAAPFPPAAPVRLLRTLFRAAFLARAAPAALALALAPALLAGPAAAPGVVRAALEPPVIGLGETATFMLEVQSHGLTGVRFDPTFTLENLEIVAGPAQSEDVSFGTGSLARPYRQTWLLRPRATGPARVRGIALQLLDRVVPLRDREIQV